MNTRPLPAATRSARSSLPDYEHSHVLIPAAYPWLKLVGLRPTRVQLFDRNAHPLHCDVVLGATAQHFLNVFVSHLRTRNHYFINVMLRADRREVAVTAEHSQPVNHFSILRGIVIEKTNWRQVKVAVVSQLSQQKLAAITRAVNQNTPAVLRADSRQHLAKQSECHPASRDKQEHQNSVD